MYGLAFVLLRPAFLSLQEELDVSLAPFRCGGEDRFPAHALAFDDATEDLKKLHAATFEYKQGSVAWEEETASLSFSLNLRRLTAHLDALGFAGFRGKFAEIEPDFDRFAQHFSRFEKRDARTGLYGSWLNPLGRWDWWERGGRFNGVITGERLASSGASGISSGEDEGRRTLLAVTKAFGGRKPEVDAYVEANVDLAATLLRRIGDEQENGLPAAIVLPYGSVADAARWFESLAGREINAETYDFLGVAPNTPFAGLVRAAYARFADHAIAGVAYHF